MTISLEMMAENKQGTSWTLRLTFRNWAPGQNIWNAEWHILIEEGFTSEEIANNLHGDNDIPRTTARSHGYLDGIYILQDAGLQWFEIIAFSSHTYKVGQYYLQIIFKYFNFICFQFFFF